MKNFNRRNSHGHHGSKRQLSYYRNLESIFIFKEPEGTCLMCLFQQDKLAAVYEELGDGSLRPVLYRVLVEHPLIQDIIVACKSFKALVGQQLHLL